MSGRELRFDGRVAVVTGAGGNPSIGRAHALLLASRGARVVVNDIGSHPEMRGYPGEASAAAVVAEIRAAGGEAVADTNSVASVEGARAIVATALDAFGRLDVLVNNAAISIAAPLDVMTPHDFERHIAINLMGAVWCCRAAWPVMKRQGYGRIVNTTSSAMTGYADQAAYATSKGGLWSLTRALAAEGMALGIKVNALSPGAYTRLVGSMMDEDSPLLQHARASMPAEACSPAMAVLAHEDCPVTGECLDSAAGGVQRTFVARTAGISAATPEAVLDGWDAIMREDGAETIGIGAFDTSTWMLKPYIGNQP
jgi:NAD(P)-dependent dehydrogenase (short-subunit alcohol dehydrogenase family)